MKKRSLFTQLLVFSAAFTVLMWFGAWAFSVMAGQSTKSTLASLEERLNKNKLVEQSQSLDLAGVERISIETDSSDVKIQSVGGENAEIAFVGRAGAGRKPLNIEKQGSALIIKVETKKDGDWTWTFGDSNSRFSEEQKFRGLKLLLPDKIAKLLEVKSGSGDVTIERLTVENLNLEARSGDIRLVNCRSEANLKTRSGDIEAHNFEGTIKAAATSGDIEIEQAKSELLDLSANSGDIEVLSPISKQILGTTKSGDISVRLPDGLGWHFAFQTNSGAVKNDWADNSQGDRNLELRTGSGDITVRKE